MMDWMYASSVSFPLTKIHVLIVPGDVSLLIDAFVLSVAFPTPAVTTTSKEKFVSSQNRCERSEEHTSELQSRGHLVCRLLLEKKKEDKSYISCHSRHKP